MSNNKLIIDLLKRKPYLKEENKSPNIGDFQYGKTSSVQEILGGVNAYRYDIYKNTNKKGTIKNLGGGNPIPFKTYKYVKKDINDYLDKNILSNYPHTSGNPKLKNEVINYLNSINVNVENNELLFTASTTHAYKLLLESIVRRHDVVLIPTPTYGLFVYGPEKVGGKVEYIELKEELNWKLDLEELNKKIDSINNKLKKEYKELDYTPRVVAIYNQNPNNPLGVSYGKKDLDYLKNFSKICKEKDVLIIDDLVYRDSVYDTSNLAYPLSSLKEYKDNIITLMGISKSYSLAGLRTGIAFGNRYIIDDMRDKIFVEMDSISIISQIAIASVFNNKKTRVRYREQFLKEIRKAYLFNLDIVKYFVSGDNSISKKSKMKIEKYLSEKEIEKYKSGMKDVSIYHNLIPESGFFILLDFTKIKGKSINDKVINNDIDLIIELYKKDKIKFLPGSSFRWNNKDDIIGRITFSLDVKTLINNMKALSKIINNI